MKSPLYTLIAFLGLSLLASACGKWAPATASHAFTNPAVLGTWRSDCTSLDGATSAYEIFQVDADGKFQSLVIDFKDTPICEETLAYSRTEIYGTLTLDDRALFNVASTGLLRAPISTVATLDFNTEQNCGLTHWTPNSAQTCASRVGERYHGPENLVYAVNGDDLKIESCSGSVDGGQSCNTQIFYHYTRVTQ